MPEDHDKPSRMTPHAMPRRNLSYYIIGIAWVLLLLRPAPLGATQPVTATADSLASTDSLATADQRQAADSLAADLADTLAAQPLVMPDSLGLADAAGTDGTPAPERWLPDPKRAMWLAIIFPGGGQIYNRKYWKLPIFYGGFIGCYYALSWNNTMYHDYAQAYMDIMDDDANTKSYESFLPPSYDVDANLERLQKLFKRKKDYYRRYRDMSMFFMMGIYALSIIDAYVDAELSSFDISRDLSMKVRPAVINQSSLAQRVAPPTGNSYGLSCSLNF